MSFPQRSSAHLAHSNEGTIADTLRQRAYLEPARVAFRELNNDLSERIAVTYAELDLRARGLGEKLSQFPRGTRALLLVPTAIDYLSALFGCFYSGIVAVSGVPPHVPGKRSQRRAARLERLRAALKGSGATVILGPADLLQRVGEALGDEIGGLRLIALDTDILAVGTWRPCDHDGNETAMLQLTSGATTSPGAVVLRHRNLTSNIDGQIERMGLTASDIGVSWLPLFHDLGLIGAALLPLRAGFPTVFLPSAGFLEHPKRWLQCLSSERGTISWAPNFAYHLCAKAVAEAERARLDLRSWRIAMNAAEPVRSDTVRIFSDAFSVGGFKSSAMYPAYGLAEATLGVSVPVPGKEPRILRVRKSALLHDRVEAPSNGSDVAELVACGKALPSVEVAIVDPQKGQHCDTDSVGEIWVSGPGVSEGYFESAARSEAFQARLPGDDRSWLRTGDLGFAKDGDLFITGRLKDLIILRGANFYPNDLEVSASSSHSALRDDCACAFSIDSEEGEGLALVCEINRRREGEAQLAAFSIRRALSDRHGVDAKLVAIVRLGAVPKTPSGKVQRSRCRQALEAGELPIIFLDRPLAARDAGAGQGQVPLLEGEPVASWVLAQLSAAASGLTVGFDTELADLGLSSLEVTRLARQIEVTFARRIPLADLFELRRVSDLVARLLKA